MEEIAEIRSSEHNIWVSVRAQPVRPVQQTGQTGLHGSAWARRRSTCQTGDQDRSDRSQQKQTSKSLLCTNPLKPILLIANLKNINARMHDIIHEFL